MGGQNVAIHINYTILLCSAMSAWLAFGASATGGGEGEGEAGAVATAHTLGPCTSGGKGWGLWHRTHAGPLYIRAAHPFHLLRGPALGDSIMKELHCQRAGPLMARAHSFFCICYAGAATM